MKNPAFGEIGDSLRTGLQTTISSGKALYTLAKKYPRSSKLLGVIGAIGIGISATIDQQQAVNHEHSRLNHAFQVADLSVEDKVKLILGTSLYSSRFDISRDFPEVGLVHLYDSEMQSIEEAKENVISLQSTGNNYIVSADIEGGWVNHLTLHPEDLRHFGIPESILNLRIQELESYYPGDEQKVQEIFASKPLPSQEWIGRVYKNLKSEKEQEEFLRDIGLYGKTIAKICEYIGIHIIFGPVLDRVEDIEGEAPIEEQDRSFGEDYGDIAELAIAYLAGVSEVPSVIAVPKHFVGNGISINDPHNWSSETYIDPKKGTSILPFRDVVNFANGYNVYDVYVQNLEEANRNHTQELGQEGLSQKRKKQLKALIDENTKQIQKYTSLSQTESLGRLKTLFQEGIRLPLIMTSNVSTNLYGDPDIPTMFSKKAMAALTRDKSEKGLGFTGAMITDDANMESAKNYIESRMGFFSDYDTQALSIYTALASGNSMVLMRFISGQEDYIAGEVAKYIEARVDLDQNGEADLSEEQLDALVSQVLEIRVQLGLLEKQKIGEKEYYVVNPHLYSPSERKVLRDSFYSNQWPWLEREEYYTNLGREDDQSLGKLAYKAAWNFGVSFYSVGLNDPFGILDSEKYADADTNPQELILIDKSAKYLWRYNSETRELIESFEIGIGKGGEGPRRVVGDHRTPVGYYEVVQKRDDQWWQENKGVPLPDFYGGKDGGMLVIAGPWSPEIAIHGSEYGYQGEVSNGCIRVSDEKVQELLREVPLGTMVIVTN